MRLGSRLTLRRALEMVLSREFIADPSSDWFNLVTRDLAVAALRPGGQEIAVLAATDTD